MRRLEIVWLFVCSDFFFSFVFFCSRGFFFGGEIGERGTSGRMGLFFFFGDGGRERKRETERREG